VSTNPVIVALDYPSAAPALELAGRLSPSLCRLKIGKELYTRCGPALVEQLQGKGFDIFLDLKFHDIPNTVAGAVRAAGERRMMEAAVDSLQGLAQKPLLIGVTVLTSMTEEDLRELGYRETAAQRVLRLSALAADCGLDGVVCSAVEATELREARGDDFCLVTPGIRLAGDSADDQRRVVTPADALSMGSDYLVIGRSITGAADPLAALERVHAELSASA
jgi:orotidine-5'-phosphate decarboxylase